MCALLHDPCGGDPHNLGTEHVRVEHLRLEGDEAIGKELCGALVIFVVDHLNGDAEALQACDGAPVRERDDVHVVARGIEAQHRVDDALLRAAIRAGGEKLHDADARSVGEWPCWRTAAAELAACGPRHAPPTVSCSTSVSTAPHSYLYGSLPRKKSKVRLRMSIARVTPATKSKTPGESARAAISPPAFQ